MTALKISQSLLISTVLFVPVAAYGGRPPDCVLGQGADSRITVVGGYVAPGNAERGASGFPAIDITIADSGEPMILILTAPDSMEWRVSAADAARVAGVFATGFGMAVVSGLPDTVPILTHSRDAPNWSCVARDIAPFAVSDPSEVLAVVPAIRQVVGRVPDEWKLGPFESPVVVRSTMEPIGDPRCAMEVPADAIVTAIGTYEGTEPPTRKTQSGEQGNRVDVIVTRTDKPTVLVLSGFDPVEWRVGHVRGARLAGVIATGGGIPIVTGIPKDVPLIVHGRAAMNRFCIERGVIPFAAYEETSKADEQIASSISSMIGRQPDDWIIGYGSAKVVVGEDDPAAQIGSLEFSAERGPVFADDADLVYPGHAGIRQLLARGVLAEGTQADFDQWKAGAVALHGHAPATSRVPGAIYRVLEETALPDGLTGANAVTFIVAPGVPPPMRAPGHSLVLVTDGYRCLGCF